MKRRLLGELEIAEIGLGCMGMTPIYGTPDEAEAIATVQHAVDHGVDMIDTADAYADGANEELVGRALKGRRDKIVLATKFGNIRYPDGRRDVNGRPEYVRQACELSLKRLQTDVIDLYYVHRIDPSVPIEDTVGAMAELATEGKIRYLGLSEAAPETLRRAHATHPITALQTEYSLSSRDPETELVGLCADLGIGYVAYAPLGRGLLAGQIVDVDSLEESDRRRDMPRYQGDNMVHNQQLVSALREMAETEGCTPAQLAIAWLLTRGQHVVPLPGTTRRERLDENIASADLTLSSETLKHLDETFAAGSVLGTRYPAAQMKRVGL